MKRIPLVRHDRARFGADVLRSSFLALAMLLVLLVPSTSRADEALRTRIESLAVEPRIDGVAVADPWFLLRFYERRQFSAAWESEAKRDALLEALARSAEHGLDPDDYHIDLLRNHDSERAEDGEHDEVHFEVLATDAL